MIGNRPSSLDIAQFCSLSPILGAEHGAGRSAAMSSSMHAKFSGATDWRLEFDRLAPEEQEEVSTWLKPTPIEVTEELILNYEDATKEDPIGLDEHCGYVDKDDPTCVTGGTVDMYWIVDTNTERVAYVPDMKRSERTSSVDSVQLHAYGLGVCAKHDCDAYVPGIWSLEDGTWEWGDMVYLDGEGLRHWNRVKAAALNLDGRASFGAHCAGCWERRNCPEWLMPPEVGESLLAPLVEGAEITNANALSLLLAMKQVKDTIEKAEPMLKTYADQHGGIVSEDGKKVWAMGKTKGWKFLDKEALEREHPGLIDKYTGVGKPGTRYTWRNAKKKG